MMKKSSRVAHPLPPGPPGLPLFGNLLSLRGQPLRPYLVKLSKTYGPIYKLQMGSKMTIIVSSSQVAKAIFKDQDAVFANHDVGVSALALFYGEHDVTCSPHGPYWRKLRKTLVHEMMSKASLDASYALRRQEVRKMVKNLHEMSGSPVNVAELASIVSFDVITSMLWGGLLPSSSVTEFRLMITEMIDLISKANISEFFPALARFDLQGVVSKVKKVLLRIDQIFESILTDQVKLEGKEGSKDLLHSLLKLNGAEIDVTQRFSNVQIKALFLDVILGADTSPTTIHWVMAEMLRHPNKMRRAREEIDAVVGKQRVVEESDLPKFVYMDAVLREILRLHPPFPILVPRRPSSSSSVAGYTIPENSSIAIHAWGMHRDPEVWENATEFEPERFLEEPGVGDFHGNNFIYVPFGSGRRICPGIPIAEKTVKFVVASLLHSFEWKLPDDAELDMSENLGAISKKTTPLIAIPSPRLPTNLYL